MPTATLIGVPYDAKSSFARGPALGPAAIRSALHSPAGNSYSEDSIEVLSPRILGDVGDIVVEGVEYPLEPIRRAVVGVIDSGSVPVVLGGDHSISYGVVRGIADRHKSFTILHFDAHSDLYDQFEGDPLSHACPFARIMEAGIAKGLVQVGTRCPTPHQNEQAKRFGVEVIDMRAWSRGVRPTIDGPCYISIDLDVLDPAFVPGISHREPGGLTPRELITQLQALANPVVGIDIVELNPARDVDGLAAATASKVLREALALLARGASTHQNVV
ncbi:MAG: agmatinase [Gemmatimonadaceae bacterium]